jgi:adenylyltransferase/sulfurtransferase
MAGPDRYIRQTILPEIGPEGQRKLSIATVAVIGLGALGTVSAGLLARAGVGHLRLVDRDVVELTNLQRQVLFDEKDVDLPKAEAAAAKLLATNSDIRVEPVAKDVHAANIEFVLEGVDLVVDGADNMELRFLLNEASIKRGLPWVYGGAIATNGMAMGIVPGTTACFRCFLPQMPAPGSLPTCDTAGILNTVSSIVGSLQAAEAIKLLVGQRPTGELLVFDGWANELQRLRVAKRKDCPACVQRQTEYLGAKRGQVIAALCGSKTISIDPAHKGEIDLAGVEARLRKLGSVRSLGSVLVFDAGDATLTVFSDGRALIRGTDDPERARSLYAKFIGM